MVSTGRFGRQWRAVAAALVLGACLAAGPPAEAFTITQTGTAGGNPSGQPIYTVAGLVEGDSFSVNLDTTVGSDTLTATALVSIFDIGNGFTLIDVDLTNSSTGSNRITHFGLAIDPNATSGSLVDVGGDGDTDAFTDIEVGNFPGFQLVEFCSTSGPNCSGGSGGGLLPGQHDQFRFSLLGGFADGGTLDLSQFGFKFQGGAESYQVPGTPVAQPTPLVLLGGGLLGLTAVLVSRARSRAR